MAKIIYGVSGEGSGHSSRAKAMGRHLLDSGHELKVVSYDRGYRNLQRGFDVLEIVGLSIASRDNTVSVLKTLSENVAKLPDGTRALNKLRALFKSYRPDCVISDFEPLTAYLASHYDLPLISLDNQHRMRYMTYDCPAGLRNDARLTETIVRAMVPRPWYSLITSFHAGTLKNDHCAVFPPLIRPAVRDVEPSRGEHVLVYATAGFDSLLDTLRRLPRESFCVYGYDENRQDGNLRFAPFSEEGFLRDLASCKAVIATAGFTLISEALHLAKPYLAFPMQGQFEQRLNSHMLDQLGLGKECLVPTVDAIAAFLYQLPEYESALSDYQGCGNPAMQERLDELLAGDLRLLKTYER
ncbi:MAG: UDP-glucuronosyltransferase [bacterium]|nr:UDP-glucuronosyltransferase [bacterium]